MDLGASPSTNSQLSRHYDSPHISNSNDSLVISDSSFSPSEKQRRESKAAGPRTAGSRGLANYLDNSVINVESIDPGPESIISDSSFTPSEKHRRNEAKAAHASTPGERGLANYLGNSVIDITSVKKGPEQRSTHMYFFYDAVSI
jgi:hypothetical protein